MSVGKKIKMYLVKNNISQTWLSEKAQIALPKLTSSLNDKRKLSADELERIIKALNIDANILLSEQN